MIKVEFLPHDLEFPKPSRTQEAAYREAYALTARANGYVREPAGGLPGEVDRLADEAGRAAFAAAATVPLPEGRLSPKAAKPKPKATQPAKPKATRTPPAGIGSDFETRSLLARLAAVRADDDDELDKDDKDEDDVQRDDADHFKVPSYDEYIEGLSGGTVLQAHRTTHEQVREHLAAQAGIPRTAMHYYDDAMLSALAAAASAQKGSRT